MQKGLAKNTRTYDFSTLYTSIPHKDLKMEIVWVISGCFNDADTVIVAPVYAAGESPIENVDASTLASAMRSGGHRDVRTIDAPEEVAGMVRDIAKPGDYVIFLGAGNITAWAHALPGELATLQ